MPPGWPSSSGNSGPTMMSSGLVQGIFRSGETAARTIVLGEPPAKRSPHEAAGLTDGPNARSVPLLTHMSPFGSFLTARPESHSRGKIVTSFSFTRQFHARAENAVIVPADCSRRTSGPARHLPAPRNA